MNEKRLKEGWIKKKPGPAPFVSSHVLSIVANGVKNADLNMASKTSKDIASDIQKELAIEAEANHMNKDGVPLLKERTARKYVAEVAPVKVKSATVHNDRRCQALADMFNSISHAAVTTAIFEPTADRPFGRFEARNVYNIDAVSTMIGDQINTSVRMAVGSKEILKKAGRSPSIKHNKPQGRTVKQFYLTSADGFVRVAIIVIKDYNVKNIMSRCISKDGGYEVWLLFEPCERKKSKTKKVVKKQKSTEVTSSSSAATPTVTTTTTGTLYTGDSDTSDSDSENNTSVATAASATVPQTPIHSKKSAIDIKVMEIIFGQIVVPAIVKKRCDNELVTAEFDELNISTGNGTNSGSNSSNTDSNANNDKLPPILLCFDGDYPQIEATFSVLLPLITGTGIEALKLPGGCSMSFQPNDLMRSHSIIHSYTRSAEYSSYSTVIPPSYMNTVDRLLTANGIEKSSADTFKHFMLQLPIIISKAFGVRTIISGWAKSGMVPLDVNVILRQCSSYRNLSAEEGEAVRASIPALAREVQQTGGCKRVGVARCEMKKDLTSGKITLNVSPCTVDGVFCANDCALIKRKLAPVCSNGTVSSGYVDDMWRGCSNCDMWFCPKVNCVKRMNKHVVNCLVKKPKE